MIAITGFYVRFTGNRLVVMPAVRKVVPATRAASSAYLALPSIGMPESANLRGVALVFDVHPVNQPEMTAYISQVAQPGPGTI